MRLSGMTEVGTKVRRIFIGSGLRGGLAAGLVVWLLVGLLFPRVAAAVQVEEAARGTPAVSAELVELADRQDALFAQIVTESGLVRYDVLAEPSPRAELQALVQRFAELPIPEVAGVGDAVIRSAGGLVGSPAQSKRLAFLINSYNLNVLEQVMVTGVPGKVLEVAGFFEAREITVGGVVLTLNELENSYVRTLGDPRIHAALNCAALSCPAMARKAFRAETLSAQLDELCRRWVNDTARNAVDAAGELRVSKIFEWFASDFAVAPFGDRRGFLKYYVQPGSALERGLQRGVAGLGFMEYDWRLNAAGEGGEAG